MEGEHDVLHASRWALADPLIGQYAAMTSSRGPSAPTGIVAEHRGRMNSLSLFYTAWLQFSLLLEVRPDLVEVLVREPELRLEVPFPSAILLSDLLRDKTEAVRREGHGV